MAADPGRSRAAPLTLDLHFPPLTRDLDSVTVHVVVEDVGEADVSAPRLGGAELTPLRVSRSDNRLQLAIDLPDLAGASVPVVRVHVDRSGSGRVQVGDFINPSIVEVPSDGTTTARVDLIEVC